MSILEQITSAVMATVEEKKIDFEYRRALNTRFASAVLRSPLPFPGRGVDNTVIAEVKMNSPTKGRLAREGDSPALIASQYIDGGAAAISVLTEPVYFEGDVRHLEDVRAVADETPVLMKDFVLDKLQIQEARAYGADGVLLIAYLLQDRLDEYLEYAKSIGLWALVETHSKSDIKFALDCEADIIGVNNRDFVKGNVDLDASIKLCQFVPDDRVFVVESGIAYPEDVRYLMDSCTRKPDAYLVGTALMNSEDKASAVRSLVDA
ncbi:MAG: indole-3-glycerol-phosphate synthase [Candidatus Altiarchaeota archaeon]